MTVSAPVVAGVGRAATGCHRLDSEPVEPRVLTGEHVGMDVPTDADVIAQSVDDPPQFGVVFDRHAGVVFRFLVRRVGRDAADELLGDTFRIAFERRGSFDLQRESARPWLYGIATNLLAKHRRTEARRFRATARLAVARHDDHVADDVAFAIDARNTYRVVMNAIAALPDGERDALLLFVWEELDYEDIAAALGIPVGTVRSRLNRARVRLRELAQPRGEHVSNDEADRARIEP
jgi:RNA polymerase sigma-70 factor (ECF subfamily)